MKTTPDKIVRVAEKHVKLYTHRVRQGEAGVRGINLPECKKYLALWKSVVTKGGHDLSPEEMNEVKDAYESGEYDDIFKETN